MKIACGGCGAKYSIADEKVGGKTFKLRCRKCSDVIVVSGEAQAAPAPATAPDAVWHLIADGEQRGPLSPPQIAELLCANAIDWEALGWREGMEGWTPLRDLASLVAQLTGSPTNESSPASRRPARSGDLFAPVDTAQSPFAAVAAPSAQPMTATRNESSVLFSLANLSALASKGTASEARASSERAVAASTASAAGDGSGLIDIRALAASQPAPESASRADDVLSIGTAPPAFAPLFGSPVLMPAKKERSSTRLVLGLGVAAVLSAGVIAAVTVLSIVRPAEPAFAAVPSTGQTLDRDTRANAQPAAAPNAPATTNATHEPTLTTADVTPPAEPALPAVAPAADEHRNGNRHAPGRHDRVAAQPPSQDATPPSGVHAPVPAHPTDSAGRDVNSVLADMFGDNPADTSHVSAPARDTRERLPEQPDREQVLSALRAMQPAVRACGGGQHGTAMTSLSVSGQTGRVSSASVTGAFQGTPVSTCVANAARGARFPRFSRATFNVTFPFAI